MIALLPFIVVFRFLLRNYEKKYTIWGWRLFFLRSICPVALSSVFCLFPVVNRKYHLLLADFGLNVKGESGIMNSWRAVYQGEVSATEAFKICSIIWAAGAFGIFLLAVVYNRKFSKELKKAEKIGDNIYEAASFSVPVSRGIFCRKLYLPKGFQAKELGWLLRHMETHRFTGIRSVLVGIIMAIHWFNPVMWLYYIWWKSDMEMAADERTVHGEKEDIRKEYAQGILNFNKEPYGAGKSDNRTAKGILLFPGVIEADIEKRAYSMLYQKRSQKRDRLAAVLLLSVIIVFLFLLEPMKIAWDGGTWGNGDTSAKTDIEFQKSDMTVVTRMGTTSPEGLERVIQLEMLSGKEGKQEYAGNFVLRMYDSLENRIASCKIENLFPEIETGQQSFSKDTTLCISDYNGDGIKELVIGQQTEMPAMDSGITEVQKTEEPEVNYVAYTYAIVSIEDKSLGIACTGITAVSRDTELGNSVYFENPEDINDIFSKILGETKEHSLEDENGKKDVLVSTRQDSTGSEAIRSVTIVPGSGSKRFDDIEGYYCDLLWVADEKGKQEKDYAQLIYNGKRAQTFVIYDIAKKSVYYKHEDGTKQLADVFKQYGEDITFQENGTVIYSLVVKEGDILRISFAANADKGITVNGSYEYDVVKRTASNLSFNRSGDGAASAAPSPSPKR